MLWYALRLPAMTLLTYTRACAAETPLAVLAGHPRQRIVALSAAAAAQGVQLGMSAASARALLPELLLRPRSEAGEAALLAELASWCANFSPQLSLQPPDQVLLEASASLRLFGGATALLECLQQGSAQLGLPAQVAAAPTPQAASWLVHARPDSLHDGTNWQAALDTLPLSLLADCRDVPANVLALLQALGLEQLGDIDHLPRDGLARRDAGMLADLLARARGQQPDPRAWFRPPEHYVARQQLPIPVSHAEPLLFACSRLIQGLGEWLQARHGGIDHCQLQLTHEHAAASVIDIVSGRPGRDPSRLSLLMREHLSAFTLPAPVEAITLIARGPRLLAPRNVELFDTPEQQDEQAEQLLERLRARLGTQALQQICPLADHRPEHAWQLAPPTTPQLPTSLPARPLWLLPTPRALGTQPPLQLLRGPERLQSGWWDGQPIARDYYAARHPDGALWWVFQEGQAWFLHGYFA